MLTLAALRSFASALRPHLARAGRDQLALWLPARCACCGRAASDVFCRACTVTMREQARRPYCRGCGQTIADARGPCGRCRDRAVRPLRRVWRVGAHEDALRRAVHAAKYAGRFAANERLARVLGRDGNELRAAADVLVPVPLHPWRQWRRGYNQAEVVARALGRALGVRVVPRALRRVRATAAQTAQPSPAARARNVKGAFALRRPEAIAGKRVVLVDDVMTTGATLRAAARALLPARPASVCAAVLTVAVAPGVRAGG